MIGGTYAGKIEVNMGIFACVKEGVKACQDALWHFCNSNRLFARSACYFQWYILYTGLNAQKLSRWDGNNFYQESDGSYDLFICAKYICAKSRLF